MESAALRLFRCRATGTPMAARWADMMLMEGFHEGDMPYGAPNSKASCVMRNTAIRSASGAESTCRKWILSRSVRDEMRR